MTTFPTFCSVLAAAVRSKASSNLSIGYETSSTGCKGSEGKGRELHNHLMSYSSEWSQPLLPLPYLQLTVLDEC